MHDSVNSACLPRLPASASMTVEDLSFEDQRDQNQSLAAASNQRAYSRSRTDQLRRTDRLASGDLRASVELYRSPIRTIECTTSMFP